MEETVLESYYSDKRTIWRFRNCGMLSPHLDGFADYLERNGFPPGSGRSYLRAARHLSQYAFHEGVLELKDLSSELIDRFLNEHLPTCSCERMNSGNFSCTPPAISYLLDYLSGEGLVRISPDEALLPSPPLPAGERQRADRRDAVAEAPELEPRHLWPNYAQDRRTEEIRSLPSGKGEVLVRYDEYLRRLFGLTDKTREIHRAKMLFFMKWIVEVKGPDFQLSELTTAEIMAFQATCNSDGYSFDYRKTMMSCLRGFLRFLRWEGILEEDLTPAVYPLAEWKRASVPRFISQESVAKLLAAPDRKTLIGARDYLMMLLCVQTGMRAIEIISVRLDDINLAKGELTVRSSKSHSERRLPISEEVADAIVEYLRMSSPRPEGTRALFLCAKAPHRPLCTSSAVGRVVERYINETGIDAPFKGSHLLRHSLATHLVNHDVTMKTTADMLGHQELDTTTIYAKVDLRHLREIALPLPATWRRVGV